MVVQVEDDNWQNSKHNKIAFITGRDWAVWIKDTFIYHKEYHWGLTHFLVFFCEVAVGTVSCVCGWSTGVPGMVSVGGIVGVDVS